MHVNRVDLSTGETLINLTGDTVTPETMIKGSTAHNSTGEPIEGVIPIADIEEVEHDVDASVVVIPSGYYKNDEVIEVGAHWENGYDFGWGDGYDEGHTEGWNEGFDEGLAQGGGGLHHLLLEQIQSENVVRINANMYCYDVSIFGSSIDYDSTFDDYVDREYSSLSSNPLTISVDNYTDLYLYLYLRVKDLNNDEQYIIQIIVPPGWNNSADVITQASMGSPPNWKTEIIGARFAVNEI